MTIISPIGYGFPGYGRAYTDVQPYTYRAAITQQEALESLSRYVSDVLAPHVDESFTAIEDDAKAIGAALEVQFQDAISDVELHAYGFTPLQGIGIDLTGGTDSTAAVQAFFTALPAGAQVVVPAGTIIALNGPITLAKRVTVTGAGELRWLSGIEHEPAFHVTADGVQFLRLRMTNPNHLAAATGNRSYGIYFAANYGVVDGCTIDGFQAPVWVDATGEWHHHVITNNRCLNVIGSGAEDRGDGIYMAGAVFVVANNLVEALPGTDARIGIGAEALQAFVQTPGYPHQDKYGIIANNIVLGPFRRSIANEGVEHVAITGNLCSGFQWWGINLAGTSHHTTVADNTIRFTATSVPNGITTAGIYFYYQPTDCRIHHNLIEFAAGSRAVAGIAATAAGFPSVDLSIESNTINGGSNQVVNGVMLDGATRPKVVGNMIRGFSGTGVLLSDTPDITVSNNEILGSTGTTGIATTGNSTSAKVTGNTIRLCSNAMNLFFRTVWSKVSGNIIQEATNGINMYGSSGIAQVSDNLYATVTTPTQAIPA